MGFEHLLPATFTNPWAYSDYHNLEPRPTSDVHVEVMGFTQMPLSRSPSASTMQQYPLQEQERPLYSIQEDIAQPLPGTVRRATFINTDHCDAWRRQASPLSSGSGFDTGITSSDRNTPPWSSLEILGLTSPVAYCYNTDVSYALGGTACLQRHDSHIDISCVSLNEVQNLADEQPESIPFHCHSPEEYSAYTYIPYPQDAYQPEEGYQPMESGAREDSTYYSAPDSDYAPTATPRNASEEPVIRRRRAPSTSVATGRVTKRPSNSRRSSSYQNDTIKVENSYADANQAKRAFPCPLAIYGCTSTFGSKNEWKRHVLTQHMRLGFWRCEQCASANGGGGDRKPNDFNRKDLFIQHVRRMHPLEKPTSASSSNKKSSNSKNAKPDIHDEQYHQSEATRCYRHLRHAPEHSQCLFCDQHFTGSSGSGSWDDRMEHIGRHMESMKKEQNGNGTDPSEWNRDRNTEDWLLQERIIEEHDGRLVLSEGRTTAGHE